MEFIPDVEIGNARRGNWFVRTCVKSNGGGIQEMFMDDRGQEPREWGLSSNSFLGSLLPTLSLE